MVLELCNRTVLLDAGRVVANGLTRNILGDPTLLEAHGLEMPLSLKIGAVTARERPSPPGRPRRLAVASTGRPARVPTPPTAMGPPS